MFAIYVLPPPPSSRHGCRLLNLSTALHLSFISVHGGNRPADIKNPTACRTIRQEGKPFLSLPPRVLLLLFPLTHFPFTCTIVESVSRLSFNCTPVCRVCCSKEAAVLIQTAGRICQPPWVHRDVRLKRTDLNYLSRFLLWARTLRPHECNS